MKVEGLVFSIIGVFLGAAGLVYWFLSKDPTGTAALGVSFGFGMLIGGYLLFTARRMEPRPQDRGGQTPGRARGAAGRNDCGRNRMSRT